MSVIYSIAPIGNAKDIEIIKNKNVQTKLTPGPVTKLDIKSIEKDKEEREVDNTHYTANDAIDDTLIQSGGENIVKKLDSGDNKPYFNNDKINAPEGTSPVMTSDIPGGDKEIETSQSGEDNTNKEKEISSDPISKSDIEDNNDDESELTKSYKDLMNRMNNLNNENEV